MWRVLWLIGYGWAWGNGTAATHNGTGAGTYVPHNDRADNEGGSEWDQRRGESDRDYHHRLVMKQGPFDRIAEVYRRIHGKYPKWYTANGEE